MLAVVPVLFDLVFETCFIALAVISFEACFYCPVLKFYFTYPLFRYKMCVSNNKYLTGGSDPWLLKESVF